MFLGSTNSNDETRNLNFPFIRKRLNVNRMKQKLTQEELANLSKIELVSMIIKLEANRKILLQTIMKDETLTQEDNVTGEKQFKTNLDFSKYHKRHILLRICYLGWGFKGFVSQADTRETVEFYLFKALQKTSLIECRQTSNYHGCGRTDKGVSAFDQVVSLTVRSKIHPTMQLSKTSLQSEINYCLLLNKVLPKEIRAIAWRPLNTPNYSARFDCTSRTYKYFFPRGDLNIGPMKEACKYLVGTHDFRNFCKMDVKNGVVNYIRRLDSVDITVTERNHEMREEFDMLCLEFVGLSYVRHMIRCLVAVLILIGQGKESPELMKQLLDVNVLDKRPQYAFAEEFPLNLFKCQFREEIPEDDERDWDLLNQWIYDEKIIRKVIANFQTQWCKERVKSSMIYEMLKSLNQEYKNRFPDQPEIIEQANIINRHNKLRKTKILDLQRGPTLSEKIESFKNKNRFLEEK